MGGFIFVRGIKRDSNNSSSRVLGFSHSCKLSLFDSSFRVYVVCLFSQKIQVKKRKLTSNQNPMLKFSFQVSLSMFHANL